VLLEDTNAELRVDGTLAFSQPEWKRTTFVIAPWEEGLAAYSQKGNVRRPSQLWSIVVVPSAARRAQLNTDVETFLSQIPAVARAIIRPYIFGQFLLLQSLAFHSEVADLAHSNANLLWLLTLAVYEGRVPPSQLTAFCRRKQVDVLSELTGHGSKAQIKFLRKVQLTDGSLSEARTLYGVLFEPAILECVRHLPTIPVGLLSLLMKYSRLASDTFVPLIAAKLAEPQSDDADKVFRMHRRLTALGRVATALRIEDVRDALHEPTVVHVHPAQRPALNAVTRWERSDAKPQVEETFPAPPLPGTTDIVPITTLATLRNEAASQRNCVLGYAGSIYEREAYLYSVLKPERATVEVNLEDGVWELGQLKSARNKEPSRKTVLFVRRWFRWAKREVYRDDPLAED